MAKGELVLIIFPFTDLSGTKLRPAVILAETSTDLTVSFITSQTHWREPGDIIIQPSIINGLKKVSLIRTSKIATIDKSLVKGVLGELTILEIDQLNNHLRTILQL